MRFLPFTLLALPAVLAAQDVERFELRDEHVAVYNLAGEAAIEPGDGAAVVVEIRRGGRDARQLRIEHGPIEDRGTVRVIYPDDDVHYDAPHGWGGFSTDLYVRDDGTFSDRHWSRDRRERGRRVRISARGGGLDAHADLRVRVPRGRRVALYLGVGVVTVRNVDGALRVDGHATPVTASGTRGELVVDVGSGEVGVTDAEGTVDVDTGSGSVTVRTVRGDVLRVDTGSGGVDVTAVTVRRLDIDTGSGSVRVGDASAESVLIDTGSGSVTAAFSGTADDVEIDTGSGSVTLTLPASFGATVDLETGSGGIDLDFPVRVRRVERDHVVGTIGDGRGRLKVDTGSGRIVVKQG